MEARRHTANHTWVRVYAGARAVVYGNAHNLTGPFDFLAPLQEFGVIHTLRLGRVRQAFATQCGVAQKRNQNLFERLREVRGASYNVVRNMIDKRLLPFAYLTMLD